MDKSAIMLSENWVSTDLSLLPPVMFYNFNKGLRDFIFIKAIGKLLTFPYMLNLRMTVLLETFKN